MEKSRLETQLFIPRNVDGEPNTDEIAKIREIEQEFSEKLGEAFVGVSIFGSVLSGYSNDSPESDIDMFVLYDAKKTKEDKEETRKKIYRKGPEPLPSGKTKGITVASADVNPVNVLVELRDFLEHKSTDTEQETKTIIKMAAMTRMVTGRKINEYRKAIASDIQKMQPEQRDEIIEAIIENLIGSDRYRLAKRKERMPELTDADHEDILEKRKEMWRKRTNQVRGFQDDSEG